MRNRLPEVRRAATAAVVAGLVVSGMSGAVVPVYAADLQLEASAGLDGLIREGRWTPVRIQIENPPTALSGEAVVEWGDARVHRAIDIAAGARGELELYIRAADVRDQMMVHLVADARVIATAMVPVRIASDSETLTVCVRDVATPSSDVPCTATVSPDALPRSMRGYDAADEVRWQAGPELLSDDQRTALRRWRSHHSLMSQGLLSFAPRPSWGSDAPLRVPSSVALAVGVELSALAIASVFWLRSRHSAVHVYAALIFAVVLGTTVSALAGRVGPGTSATVRYQSALIQVADGATLHLRGTLEYPAMASYEVRLGSTDAALTRYPARGSSHWYDNTGRPLIKGEQGRASRERIEVEATLEAAPFAVTFADEAVRITNVSGSLLTDCRFPAGFSRVEAGTLAPGASTEATLSDSAALEDPFFVCQSTAPPIAVLVGTEHVPMYGTTSVSTPIGIGAASAAIQ